MSTPEKRKAQRKAKQKERRQKLVSSLQKEKAEYLFCEAMEHRDAGNPDRALVYLEKAVHLSPKNIDFLNQLGRLGQEMGRYDIELKALQGLYRHGLILPDQMYHLCHVLKQAGKYEDALSIIQETLPLISRMRVANKRFVRADLLEGKRECQSRLEATPKKAGSFTPPKTIKKPKDGLVEASPKESNGLHETPIEKEPLPEITLFFEMDARPLFDAVAAGSFSSPEDYDLTLQGYRISLRETFDSFICLNTLRDVQSFWHQEETARKILRVFRGRALLADEVGLGKTIEALIVLKEYIQRGMVRSALILTPSPLVSQWKEELRVKFGLDFPSTDDIDFRTRGESFWEEPFILASINVAKSKNNFRLATEREYDLVIVDEAHHLKNRNTLNWKLVNSLRKRFLLLLTATPVENNLLELYNLVTLLKPGQLKTASEFRKDFMSRGDPTDPQNRSQLKELLGQVMIRNTRALAKIGIPPRFAQTIRVEPQRIEEEIYQRICTLVRDMNAAGDASHRLLLKNLLEEAGSSPRALVLTLSRISAKQDRQLSYMHGIQEIRDLGESLDESGKNRILLNLINSSQEKRIIFVKYLGTLEYISEFLAGHNIPHALFHGQMDNRTKDEEIQKFRESVYILVTTEIGGEGRNLQFCHHMVNYDLPWNPMRIEQRIGRIHRIGQEKEVMIYSLCAAGSVEDYILEILDKKINMFEMVIGEIDMIVGRVTGELDFSDMVYDLWINSTSEEERKKGFSQLGEKLKRAKTGYLRTKALDGKLFGENYEL